MKILNKAQCGTLSNPSKKTLTYNVGNREDEYYMRLSDNEGSGFFSTEWVGLSDITNETPSEEPFTTAVLTPLYESKSSNNPGFLAAVLVAEGLWLPVEDNKRLFTYGDTCIRGTKILEGDAHDLAL